MEQMSETIQIRCPFCGALLTVSNQYGIESKNVTCPVCKTKGAFTEFNSIHHQSMVRQVDAVMHRQISDSNTYSYNILRCHRYEIDNPYWISSIMLREENMFLVKTKRAIFPITIDDVQKIVEYVKTLKPEEYLEQYHICPVCGNILRVKISPRELGDDYIYNCLCCKNEFVFGGTYFTDHELTPLSDLSPNPLEMARKILAARSKMIAELRQCEVITIGDTCVIVKSTDMGIQVTGIMQLNG